jgi:hypothetical protein
VNWRRPDRRQPARPGISDGESGEEERRESRPAGPAYRRRLLRRILLLKRPRRRGLARRARASEPRAGVRVGEPGPWAVLGWGLGAAGCAGAKGPVRSLDQLYHQVPSRRESGANQV